MKIENKGMRVINVIIVKLGSRSKVYLKSQIRDLDLELVTIIAMSPPTNTIHETVLSGITLKPLHVQVAPGKLANYL